MRFMLILITLSSIFVLSEQRVFPIQGNARYAMSYNQAWAKCLRLGAALASPNDLKNARQSGFEHCSCGWLADKSVKYPMIRSVAACGGKPGLHKCEWRDTWDAYCYTYDQIENCSKPLGMESGTIKDVQITASSVYHTFWNERWGPERARINRGGVVNGWMPHFDGRNQFISVDLGDAMAVTGIVTQGLKRYMQQQFVSKFTVSSSKDGEFYIPIIDVDTGKPKVFTANDDNAAHVRNVFDKPVLGQHIRIYPYQWRRHISLRLELYGCSLDVYHNAIEQMRDTGVFVDKDL